MNDISVSWLSTSPSCVQIYTVEEVARICLGGLFRGLVVFADAVVVGGCYCGDYISCLAEVVGCVTYGTALLKHDRLVTERPADEMFWKMVVVAE